MSVIVTAIPGEAMLSASQSHSDGSTSAVPGSPFMVAEIPQKLLALGSSLVVQGKSSISVFDVDKETGSLKQIAFLPAPLLRDAVVSPADSTVYLLDQNSVSGFRLENDRMVAVPGSPFALDANETSRRTSRALALDSTGESLYVAFAPGSSGEADSFAVFKREAEGSLSSLSSTSDIPEEVQRTFAATTSASGVKTRMAAIISLQAPSKNSTERRRLSK